MRVDKSCVLLKAHRYSRNSKNLPLPSNSKTFSGDLTYYEPGLGACGETSTKDDKIVSLSHLLFDAAGMKFFRDYPESRQILMLNRFDIQQWRQLE